MTPHEQAVAGWLTRAADMCRQLASQRREMDAYTIGGSSPADITNRRGTKVWPDAPINLGPIDLMDEIDTTTGHYADLVRGTLRLGLAARTTNASAALGLIAENLRGLNEADPDLTTEAVEKVWGLHRKASLVVEPPRGRRPFRIEQACPACGHESLWFDPNGWRIACGMPACRGVWGVSEPVLACP